MRHYTEDEDSEGVGTGWLFSPMETTAFMGSLREALSVYHGNRNKWNEMQKEAMEQDLSWNKAGECKQPP